MRKRIFAFLVALALLLAIGIGAVLLIQSPSEASRENLSGDPIDSIRELVQSRSFQAAYDLAADALEQDSSRADIALEAGLLSVILEQPEEAQKHMRTAWDLGTKRLSVLLVIIDTFEATTAERIEEFERLFPEIEQTSANRNAKGRFYSRYGLHDKALQVWSSLAEETGDEAPILQMARKLEMIGRREAAIDLLKEYAVTGQVAAEGYNLLLSLLVFENDFTGARQLLEDLETDDPHGEWALKQALFKLTLGQIPEAEQSLSELVQANSDHPIALIVAHEARIYTSLLRVILEGADADLTDLYAANAQEIQSFPQRNVTTPLLGLKANLRQIESERLFYDFFDEVMNQDDTAAGQALFIRLESFSDSPVIRWLGIRNALISNRPGNGVALYLDIEDIHPLERIEGGDGFFYKSPLFITEAARAFHEADRHGEALALISHLHERGLHTPTSIRLFAQITETAGIDTNQTKVQEALGRQFKDDLGIQLAAVNQAYLQGNQARALELITPLAEKKADNDELRMLELMLLLEQGKIEEVLAQSEASDLPLRNKKLIRARTALIREDVTDAEKYFKQALDSTDFYAYLDYARFLVEQKRPHEASPLYEAILEKQPDNPVALQGKAIIHELEGKPEEAVWALRQILSVTPDDSYVQTRLAKLQLQMGRVHDALRTTNKVIARAPDNEDAQYLQITALIRLALDQPAQATQERKLLEVEERLKQLTTAIEDRPPLFLHVYLAAAYRDIGMTDKTSSIYRTLLAMNDSAWSSSTLNREDVKRALETLHE
ncbi:MAG: tetratricopeptide repeat protein [Verrucomicrobiota bacterium]